MMFLAPVGEVDSGVEVAINGTPATTGEHPISQRQAGIDGPTLRAELARRIPPVGDGDVAAAPGLFVAE